MLATWPGCTLPRAQSSLVPAPCDPDMDEAVCAKKYQDIQLHPVAFCGMQTSMTTPTILCTGEVTSH